MKTHLAKLRRAIVWILTLLSVIGPAPPACADDPGQKAVEETRQSLRREGFKTDLADFDFSTSPELRAREAVLNATRITNNRPYRQFVDNPNLMETVGSNAAVVVWKLAALERQYSSGRGQSVDLTWNEFRAAINADQPQMDAAGAAILSGPIRFNLDAHSGNNMLLPHLALLKNLTEALNRRAVLDLHDGNLSAAWTNLMAATRLVTAWEPEPVEISHLVRLTDASLAFDAIWQALQTNGWPDESLARLQAEWESVDFFTHLPETAAFKRASDLALCHQERQQRFPPLAEFLKMGLQYPPLIWDELNERWSENSYRKSGSYEDEKALLLFYRDRELELRHAVTAQTWSAMRRFPGVTNVPSFQSEYHSLLQSRLRLRAIQSSLQNEGSTLLGRTARAEAQRRLIVAALALERYRGKHGSYPNTLSELAPEFLKKTPVDFMDGQPLRYRATNNGHFILYSIDLDCVDHGGQMPPPQRQRRVDFRSGGFTPAKNDIVWPLPASTEAVEAARADEAMAFARRLEAATEMTVASQWNHAARHQADVEKLLAAPAPPNPPDLIYHGRRLSEVLRNQAAAGAHPPTLGEMLTLKQINTGAEPETVTFELPVSYDVVTRLGNLFLYIDTNNDDSAEGCSVQQMKCARAPNGNCRLVWSTIYESPGKHALQAGLFVNNLPRNSPDISGPLLPFTITNLCQFSLTSAFFDPATGATYHAKLPESNGNYTIELNTVNGALLKTVTGSTSNGVIKVYWDLIDDHNRRFTDNTFNSVFHITLPDSGRSQTLNGP